MKKMRTPWLETTQKVVPRSIRDFGPEVAREFVRRQVLTEWPKLVGKSIARHVKAVAIEKRALLLYTIEPVWANQIRMMMPDILQKVNNYAGRALIKELRFTRRSPSRGEGVEVAEGASAAKRREKQSIRQEPVSEEAMARARKTAALTEDEALCEVLLKLSLRREQRKSWQKKEGYHPCPTCTTPIERDRKECLACAGKRKERLRSAVRAVLQDIPWARLKDVQEYVPECTLKLLNDQRSELVQRLAAGVDIRDKTSLAARTLVMLAKSIPPEKLTEEVVTRALYELRFDLYRPPGYKLPKRYEVLPLGKRGKGTEGKYETGKKER